MMTSLDFFWSNGQTRRSKSQHAVTYVSIKNVISGTDRLTEFELGKIIKGGSKTQNGHFSCIMALRLNKVCYKVSLCENCQRQSCKAFIGLTIRAKMIGGVVPFYLKFWVKLTALEQNRRLSIYFRL